MCTIVRDTIPIKAGWNMIGVLNKKLPISQITTVPLGILTSNFFGYIGGYNIADTLKPGFGYWIKSSSNGIILLNSPLNRHFKLNQISSEWASITITDALSRKMELYLSEDADKEMFYLPPMPPGRSF